MLPAEITQIWGKPISVASVLFIITRYTLVTFIALYDCFMLIPGVKIDVSIREFSFGPENWYILRSCESSLINSLNYIPNDNLGGSCKRLWRGIDVLTVIPFLTLPCRFNFYLTFVFGLFEISYMDFTHICYLGSLDCHSHYIDSHSYWSPGANGRKRFPFQAIMKRAQKYA